MTDEKKRKEKKKSQFFFPSFQSLTMKRKRTHALCMALTKTATERQKKHVTYAYLQSWRDGFGIISK
jgi:hypothetical protein